MPKVKKPPDKYDKLKLLVRGSMAVRGVTQAEIANRWACSTDTVSRRLKCPDTMTLGEVKKLAALLDIPADSMRAAIPF